MLVAIDWDGTLIKHPPNIPLEEIVKYPPTEDAVMVVNYLASKGIGFYVCTNRSGKELSLVRRWMRHHGFPPMRVTNKKLKGTAIYIDDRALRFTNWIDMGKYFA